MAAKKKKLADRNASRDEFSKPLEPVPEETELNENPIETFVNDLTQINYEMVNYDALYEAEFNDDSGTAATAKRLQSCLLESVSLNSGAMLSFESMLSFVLAVANG